MTLLGSNAVQIKNRFWTRVIKDIVQLDSYPWSGHSAVVGICNDKWMNTEYVLSQFGSKRKKATEAYRQFIKEELNMGRIPESTGGGLIHSLDGWSQAIPMRKKDIEVESDERILGGNDFVANIIKDAEEKQIRYLKLE